MKKPPSKQPSRARRDSAQPTSALIPSGAPGPISPERISQRCERIRGWHASAKPAAWKLKLIAFFAGMEIQALKAELGVTQGGDRTQTETIPFAGKAYATWAELVSGECGITDRTARNYAAAYHNMAQAAPKVTDRILKLAAPVLDATERLALPDPEQVISAIPEKDLVAFREATDPWNLSEIYQRPLKPAHAQVLEENTKSASKKKEEQALFKFWFDDFDAKLHSKSHLRLPRPKREMLLNTLELTVSELRDSLRVK